MAVATAVFPTASPTLGHLLWLMNLVGINCMEWQVCTLVRMWFPVAQLENELWEWESAGVASNQGKHLLASVHEVGLLVLHSTLSAFRTKPQNRKGGL